MSFYLLRPDVPADFGEVVYDDSVTPRRVVSAHFEFAYPVERELMKSYSGAYAVTKPLADALAESDLNGSEFGPVTTSISSLVEDPEDFDIPPLFGLIITGRAFVDDFGIKGRSKLIASQRAAEFLFARDEILREYSSRLDENGEIIIDL
ncbi:hypothetical protein [Nocardia bhagyanarayanae]|uniref:Uncharacterized protein n=1 Tax=Nocardia bhagyanarayanae TaxID=1215925 RepID=A0A543F7P5_9NOCA|nr:hypothetical protein [Nocardia bhagyanarayanae]TQM29854.1 hypothetical protein FB390_1467 [Nocardia bhagyanarayanae]